MESDEKKQHKTLPESPLEKSSIFSYILFTWLLPVFIKGNKKELEIEDLYRPLEGHKSELLGDKLCQAWFDELEKYKKDKKHNPSLLSAGFKVFRWEIILLGLVLVMLEFGIRVTQPLFLGGLIAYYSKANGNINEAYLYAGGVIVCSCLNVLIVHPYMLSQLHTGMKMRIAACSMIYRKALRLTKNALGESTAGQVVNLLSNDVARLELSVLFVHYLWVGPLEVIVISVILFKEIGVSAFFGVAFLLFFVPLQIVLGKLNSNLRLKTALRTDERVRFMNEIVNGIQVIKMYAWERPFSKLVEMARLKEVRVIRQVSYIRGILLSFIMFLTRVSVFLSLVGYVLLGYQIGAQKAFIVTAFFNTLRASMTVFFPQGIGQLAETLVSVQRIQKFMLYEELDRSKESLAQSHSANETGGPSTQSTVTKGDQGLEFSKTLIEDLPLDKEAAPFTPDSEHLSKAGVHLENVTAKWDPTYAENTLENISLRVQPGTLVAVVGPVGAGKSSLIQAILGELQVESGSIEINGEISYASQEPWLFSASIRQNILFGLPYDRERYRKIVKRCALERDFTLFSNGDKTIVGERGTSLSGGQKARINLARAVYRNHDIYLLDDPLSAVDSHVGRHLFDQCIRQQLRGKIVILVTHQLQYLQNVDQIVILELGLVKAVGTYDSLRESGLDFAKLLANPEDTDDEREKSLSRSSSKSMHQRRSSNLSAQSEEQMNHVGDQREIKQEGTIGFTVYKKYFKASGGWFIFSCLAFMCVLAQFLASCGDWFLTYWVNKQANITELRSPEINSTATSLNIGGDESNLRTKRDLQEYWNSLWIQLTEIWESIVNDQYFDVYLFTAITILTVIITLGRTVLFFNSCMRASKNLHNTMFIGITRARMYFFNTNPSGRILNRFSKDMGQVDEILPGIAIDVVQIFLALAGIILVVAIVNPYFLIPTVIIGIIFYFLRVFYLKTSTSVKRIEATTRSPIYSHLASSLQGLSTIRAFKAEQILIQEFDSHQNLHTSAFYLFLSVSRAFGFWLDSFCVLYIAIVTLSFFVMGDNGGNVGLAITQALGMTGMVQWGMRQSAELENTMTAVERIIEYETVDPEPELESSPDKKPPVTWPEEGNITFDKLSLRYFPDPNSETVLKELEFDIQAKEKVGIVGRTGAGKSSLINALFRLSYNEGTILIDTRDTNAMGLHDLRAKISIIPQEPVLFSGTLRYNLDPFDEFSDDKLWMALDEVKLKAMVKELPAGLASKISEGGTNFSVGQRQLVCLARAILRDNKILVMDEATANVDPQTDALIQETIRTKFKDCTVLTIAHRLNTVMDSDKVLVMDAGRCIEFGPPYELLTAEDGPRVFYGMVKQTGKSTFDTLLKISEEAYKTATHTQSSIEDSNNKKSN